MRNFLNFVKLTIKIVNIAASSHRVAVPIMTHPGIELTGRRVIDAVTDGKMHYEAIAALAQRFPAAAATTVMDLTVEAEAFGAQIKMEPDEVASVTGILLPDAGAVAALKVPDLDAGRVGHYLLADRLCAENIAKPVLAGMIGPFSLAGRLMGMTEIMMAIFTEPDTVEMLLEKCTEFLMAYLKAIKATGVAGVIIAEPAAGLLSDADCRANSSVYVRRMVDACQDDDFMVVLHNCGNTGHCTGAMLATGAAAIHVGNRVDMVAVLEEVPAKVVAMGNLDPVGVFKEMNPAGVYRTVSELLEKTAGFPDFIVSSGCDTPPGVPMANIEAFYKALNDFNDKRL